MENKLIRDLQKRVNELEEKVKVLAEDANHNWEERCKLTFEYEELKKTNEELYEDNIVYHTIMNMQNKREFRSKFLKEFQAEYGPCCYPDYDEIYKRYYKLKAIVEKKEEKEYPGQLSLFERGERK